MSLPEIPINHHVSQPITLDDQVQKLKQTLLKDIQRSAYVYRVDCGGCNGCEIEIFSAITPVFDAERFGIKVVASPRHADILLFTGAVTRQMRVPALRAYESAPDQKSVSLMALVAVVAVFSTISIVYGVVANLSCLLMCGSPVALRHLRRRFMDLLLHWVC